MSTDNLALFDPDEYENWRDLWVDMPAYSSQDEKPFDSINVQFSSAEDRRRFLLMLGEDPNRRKSIWFPSVAYLNQSTRNAEPCQVPAQRYPIYLPSKGRALTQLTSKALSKLGINHYVAVEPPDWDLYEAHRTEYAQLLRLPFENLGMGAVPARNWIWEHARASGAGRHWQLDDNIDGFYRLNENLKIRVVTENPFSSVEDWVDRWANVPMAGLNYEFFADRRSKQPPLRLNRRVYSCTLLTNGEAAPDDPPDLFKWRGRYNDDTDLSLRILKAGYCTALFNHYLAKKLPTMTLSGGMTDEMYKQTDQFDGRLAMAESLMKQHPDVATVTWKWGRWQHHVNYEPFRGNKLVPVPQRQAGAA